MPQLVSKDMLSAPICALESADYRMSGILELLVVAGDGEVRGYVPTPLANSRDHETIENHRRLQVRMMFPASSKIDGCGLETSSRICHPDDIQILARTDSTILWVVRR